MSFVSKECKFGDRIRAWRIKNFLTQQNIADLIFTSIQNVSAWENDRQQPLEFTAYCLDALMRNAGERVIGLLKDGDLCIDDVIDAGVKAIEGGEE